MIKVKDQHEGDAPAGSLCARVLGAGGALVHPQVAKLHCRDRRVVATGAMRVETASGPLGWSLRKVLGMPRGPIAAVRLEIMPGAGGEDWIRRFGDGRQVHSRLDHRRAGQLVERIGLLALVFALDATGDVLRFEQVACAVQLGPVGVPISRHVVPRVEATAGPGPFGGVAVAVTVHSRLLGRLLAYEGVVDVEAGPG